MKNKLKKWSLDLIGEQYKKALLGIFAYLLSIAGILKLKAILQTPIPLWIVILISLSILFGCVILFLIHSRKSSKTPSYKIEYFTIGDLKWKTKVYDHCRFEIEIISVCKEHNLLLIKGPNDYYCPEIITENCKIMIDHDSYSFLYGLAKSYIDKEIRTKINC